MRIRTFSLTGKSKKHTHIYVFFIIYNKTPESKTAVVKRIFSFYFKVFRIPVLGRFEQKYTVFRILPTRLENSRFPDRQIRS